MLRKSEALGARGSTSARMTDVFKPLASSEFERYSTLVKGVRMLQCIQGVSNDQREPHITVKHKVKNQSKSMKTTGKTPLEKHHEPLKSPI